MENNLNFQSIQANLAKAKSILVLAAANPSLDTIAASLAIYLSFRKQGKNINVACPTPITVAFNRLVAVNKVAAGIGNRNLVVSFDYIKDSIEKVSYNIENNRFNLVVEPKSNQPPLNPNKVSYSYSGTSADIVFIVGATKLEDLGKFYLEEKKFFTDKLTINIDNKPNNTRFGKINFYNPQATSCCEIVVSLIKSLNLFVDSDISTNIYAGIKANTANFQAANVSASTFEASAWCLKNGARKNQFLNPIKTKIKQPELPPEKKAVVAPLPPFSQPAAIPFNQQSISIENKEAKAPPDWLKPKIYRGNSQV